MFSTKVCNIYVGIHTTNIHSKFTQHQWVETTHLANEKTQKKTRMKKKQTAWNGMNEKNLAKAFIIFVAYLSHFSIQSAIRMCCAILLSRYFLSTNNRPKCTHTHTHSALEPVHKYKHDHNHIQTIQHTQHTRWKTDELHI